MRYIDHPLSSILPDTYERALGITGSRNLPEQFKAGDVLVMSPWRASLWAWLPTYVSIEIVPDGGEVVRHSPLEHALRDNKLPVSYIKKPPTERSKNYALYQEAMSWVKAQVSAYNHISLGIAPAPYELVNTQQRAQDVISKLATESTVAMDYETVGSPPRIVAVALANAQDSYLVYADGLKALPQLHKLLLAHKGIVVHYARFEYKVTWDASLGTLPPTKMHPFYDTNIMSWLQTNTLGESGLKSLARTYLSKDALTFEQVAPNGNIEDTLKANPDLVGQYAAAGDARNTFDLFHLFKQRLIKDNLWLLYNTIERPLTPILVEMEEAGLRVNRDNLALMLAKTTQERDRLTKILNHLGFKGYPTENDKVARWFYEELGLPVLRLTPSGKRGSVDDATLNALFGQHPAIALYQRWTELNKLITTFLQPAHQSGQDFIHTKLNQTSTRTGRLSSSGPNLQNWPIKMRSIFMPTHDGDVLLSVDYSQMEPRIAAVASQDEKMLSDYHEGRDAYITLGLDLGFDAEKVISKESITRKTVKGVFLGWMYGAGGRKMQETARNEGVYLTLDECYSYKHKLEQERPAFVAWRDKVISETRETGASYSMYGRRRLLPAIWSRDPNTKAEAEREAVNIVVQGTSADIVKKAMVQIGIKYGMVLQIHDELLFSLPASQVEDAAREITHLMESVCDFVPLRVDAHWSEKSWYDTKVSP